MKNKKEESQFEIRDLRDKSKFVMDDKFLNGYARFVKVHAVGVYSSLCRHANKEQSSWPSIKTIDKELNIGRATVIRSIKRLEFWKIIKKERVGKRCNNRYYLIDKKYWKPISEVSVRYFTEVSGWDFSSIRVILQGYLCDTSNSKETHSKETHSKERKNNLGIYKDVDEVLKEKINEKRNKIKSFSKRK